MTETLVKTTKDEKQLSKYTRDEVYSATLNYFKGDTLATEVWINKYCLKDSDGNLYELTPDDMHWRLANELARIEAKYPNPLSAQDIFDKIKNFEKIVPQGSPMAGIGNNFQVVSLGNCFVIGNEFDSYGSVLKIDQEQIQLMKRRGGVGHDLSHIRPSGSFVNNGALTSTGIVPFMERYSNSTREVAQSGRRGALMLSVDIRHPESENFIDAKLEKGKVTGANVSVKINKEFMEAALNNENYTQQFPIDSLNPKITRQINANKLWKKIVGNAWKCVPYNTEIFVYENNIFKKMKIGDLYFKDKSKFYYEIPSLNLKTKKIEKKPISDFQRYENNKNVFELKTESNKSAVATDDHIFYVLDTKTGLVKESEISNLNVGDYLIISNSTKPVNSTEQNEISLIDNLDNVYVSTNTINDILQKKDVIDYFGKFKNNEYKITSILRYGKINLNEFLNGGLSKYKDEILSRDNKYYYNGIEIHKKFVLTKEFLEFVGLFYAEGDLKKNTIRLNIHKDEIEDYQSLFDYISNTFQCKWYHKVDGNSCVVSIHSSLICSIFKLLNIGKEKKVFDLLWSLNNDLISAFLKGVFSGDGTISDDGRISISQTRKYFIEDISKMLIILGIHSMQDCFTNKIKKIKNKETKKISTSYRISIYKQYVSLFKEHIGFLNSKKQEILNKQNCDLKHKFGYPLNDTFKKKVRIFENQNVSETVLEKHLDLYSHKLDVDDMIYMNNIISEDVHYEKIVSVNKLNDKVDYVYDITVEDNHTFVLANGITLSNSAEPGILFWDNILKESIPSCYGNEWVETSTNPCGELPLPPYDSCRLLAVNLYSYVVNPFTKDAYFDWDSFKRDTIIAERLMDDIVDLELEKIDKIINKIDNDPESDDIKAIEKNLWIKIKRMCEVGRRTGLGITGEGDMLAALGLKYGTDEANDFAEEVHKIFKLAAYRSSVTMAKERGTFPIYDSKLEANNSFILRLKEEDGDLYNDMLRYGRRNIALLTIAPTGSVSILAQVSSGIECVFLPYYTRRRKINPDDKNVRVDFVDEVGDHWMEYPVFHHKFETWLRVNNYDVETIKSTYTSEQINELVKLSPYYGATSNDVDWVKKVEMQGRIQRHIDHSISVTVNLPNSVTEEIVSKVYEMGYKSGCKGITVYRDGSRSGVLVSGAEKKKREKEELFKDHHAPKRPKRLKADVIRFQNNLEKWIGVVGLLDGRPYEIFTGKLENGLSLLPPNISECEIVKVRTEDGKKRYDIEFVDANGEKQTHTGLNHTFNPEYWNYAKLISSVLRHGMPIVYVLDLIQSLNLNDEHLNTWKNGVARVIKRYIKDGEKGNSKCPSCGSENLEYKEGCLTCVSCGNSKCG